MANYLFILILLVSSTALSQPPDTLWTRILGGPGSNIPVGIRQTHDNGYIVGIRTTRANVAGSIARLDSNGQLLWQRDISIAGNLRVSPSDVCETDSGNIVLAGVTENLDSIIVVKCNADGDTIWTRAISLRPHHHVRKVVSLRDKILVLGEAWDAESQYPGGWAVLLDTSGDTIWTHTDVSGTSDWPPGYYYLSWYSDAISLSDSDAVTIWYSLRHYLVPNPWRDFYDHQVHLTFISDSTVDWFENALMGTESPNRLLLTQARDTIISLSTTSSGASRLRLFSRDGALLKASALTSSAIDIARSEEGTLIALSDDGAGLFLECISDDGIDLWSRSFGIAPEEEAVAIESTSDGGHVILASLGGAGDDSDFVIIKTDPYHFVFADERAYIQPLAFALRPNFPNPFNPETEIAFELPRAMNARLAVYDLLGREVAVLQNGLLGTGEHSITFNGSALSSGVYLYRLEIPEGFETRKMVLLK